MLDPRTDDSSTSVLDSLLQARPGSVAKSSVGAVSSPTMIGKSLTIKGEITGTESIHIEGTVEGTISLLDERVTVGSSGRVSADIAARDIVVHGELTGSCDATDHLYVRREGSLCGDIVASCISVEEGAHLSGKIDIRREPTPAPESAEPEPIESAHVN